MKIYHILTLTLILIIFILTIFMDNASILNSQDNTEQKFITYDNRIKLSTTQIIIMRRQADSQSQTITIDPVADATINNLYPNTNYGNRYYNLSVKYLSSRQIERPLIRFNIASQIPYDAVIDSAFLNLHLFYSDGPDYITLTARCIKQDWIETEVTWNNKPTTGPPVVTNVIETSPGYKHLNVTEIVKSWHQVPHYGLELIGPENESIYEYLFHNRQQESLNPFLEITYHLNNETEPLIGWCCKDGDLFNSLEDECVEIGGSFYTNFEEAQNNCQEQPPTDEYDILLKDIWHENELIYFEIINNGSEIINEGVDVSLFINDEFIINEYTVEQLEPGQNWISFFNYAWHCENYPQSILVWADYENNINEFNEENNLKEKTWICEQNSLEIISGPTLLEITPNSAAFSWETNIASDSTIAYGRFIDEFEYKKMNSSYTTIHIIELLDLQPYTMYCYSISSTNNIGESIESEKYFFKTLPIQDEVVPNLILNNPGPIQGIQRIFAEATDNQKVEYVKFYFNNTLISTDYSPPYDCYIDSTKYENGFHNIKAIAYDTSNNQAQDTLKVDIVNFKDDTIPSITFHYPGKDQIVSGSVDMNVSVNDDTALLYGTFLVDGNWSGNWYPSTEGATNETFLFPWHTSSCSNGKHRIAFQIYDTEFNVGIGYQDVIVNNTPISSANLDITSRKIIRNNNYFQVILTVKNVGQSVAEKITIHDSHQLFQPIAKNTTDAYYNLSFTPELTTWKMEIDSKVDIQPGSQQQYMYYVVPVLIPSANTQPIKGGKSVSAIPPKSVLPIIGGTKYVNSTDLWYESSDKTDLFYKRIPLSSIEISDYHLACKSSDYLIVTSPRNLFTFNPLDDVNVLLSSMAELAQLKKGILGFLDPAAQVRMDFEKNDVVIAHDMNNKSSAELIVADSSKDEICIYSLEDKTEFFTLNDGSTVPYHFNWWKKTNFPCGKKGEGFDKNDRLAVGQIGSLNHVSIVMSDYSEDKVYIYDDKGSLISLLFYPTFFNGITGLAIGDVDNDGSGEIIIADAAEDTIIFYYHTGRITGRITIPLDENDGIIVGDFIGDEKEEIIIASDKHDTIYVYDNNGTLLQSFNYRYDNGDGLAAGNMISTWPIDKEEIILGDPRGNDITILSGDGLELDWFSRELYSYDGFTVGDMSGTGVCDVVIADQVRNFLEIHDLDQTTGNPYVLKDLLKPCGSWSSKLSQNWTREGYLLIVGETEIIPSWAGKNFGSIDLVIHGKELMKADITDYPYASTYGLEIIPELAIGRIIGNSAQDLRVPIETSINVEKNTPGYGYDHSNYFAVSGYPKGISGKAADINFKQLLWEITKIFHQKSIFGSVMNTPDYTVYNANGSINEVLSHDSIEQQFFTAIPNHDIIFLSGHGSSGGWDEIKGSDVLTSNNPFGSVNPVVYAASCNTGGYHYGLSFAEAMLMKGAGAYYGATRWALSSHNGIHMKFFQEWDKGLSIGDVARDIKQKIAFKEISDYIYPYDKGRYYSSIFQVYGDPKYGLDENSMNSFIKVNTLFSLTDDSEKSGKEKTTMVQVNIPSYETETFDNQTYLMIPDGELLLVDGQPIVPSYQVIYEFPCSYHIQNIQVNQTTDQAIDSPIDLPIFREAIHDTTTNSFLPTEYIEENEWWPSRFFDWSIYENNASSTLIIRLYPYQYNLKKEQARFINSINLDIHYVYSPIEITQIQLDKSVYEPGEPIDINLELLNTEKEEMDVILNGVIKLENAEKIYPSIPLTHLKSLRNTSTYDFTLDSSNLSIGYYAIVINIRNMQGNIIDSRTEYLKIGSVKGIISNLMAKAKVAQGKSIIDLSMQIYNVGSAPLTGTVFISAKNPTNNIVFQRRIDVENISKNDSKMVSSSWDVTDFDQKYFQLNALLFYDGTSSSLQTITFNFGEDYSSHETPLLLLDLLAALVVSFLIMTYIKKSGQKI
ncbi:MAG: DNRLRE domain-containing protein [Candidatus Thermoplasmatota archaeon]|nr:DNRLRE domain-containing protein [Candidatus Thermoplasmatota archaeon]